MNKKIISLLLSILIALTFTSCNIFKKSEPDILDLLDPQKAREVALEYMENKYGEEFEIVQSAYLHYNDEKGIVVVLNKADDEEKTNYQVKVYLDEEDKTTHYVYSDTYMSTLVTPILEKRMNEEFDSISQEYIGSVSGVSQLGENMDILSFVSDFPIPSEEISLDDFSQKYKLSFDYNIELPISRYNNETEQKIWDRFHPYFTDDYVLCRMSVYSDEDYFKLETADNWRDVYENEAYWNKEILFEDIILHESELRYIE